MNKQELKPGFEFAVSRNLTPKELKVLLYLIDKDYTINELAAVMNMKPKSLFPVIQRMKNKGSIELKSKIKLDKKENVGVYGIIE